MNPQRWCMQIHHARLMPDWTVKREGNFEECVLAARAYRGDGYDARIRRWCETCSTYKASHLGDRCDACRKGIK